MLPHHKYLSDPTDRSQFECSSQLEPQYDEYFSNHLYKPLPPTQVFSRIGKRAVTVHDLNTLAPGKWLNDTILSTYLNLLGNAVYVMNKKESILIEKICTTTAAVIAFFFRNFAFFNY
jgi:Ulp1 family protease